MNEDDTRKDRVKKSGDILFVISGRDKRKGRKKWEKKLKIEGNKENGKMNPKKVYLTTEQGRWKNRFQRRGLEKAHKINR